MIRIYIETDSIIPSQDLEDFVVSMFDAIKIANQLSASYSITITKDDVALMARALDKITNVEVS